jgi:hypothetical protein
MVTIRTPLALIAAQSWQLHQFRCQQWSMVILMKMMYVAFHATGQKGETRVYKLNKSLYGLKQIFRQLYAKLPSTLNNAKNLK